MQQSFFFTADKHFLIHHYIFPQTSFSEEMIPQGKPSEKKQQSNKYREGKGINKGLKDRPYSNQHKLGMT